ncbi:MAG TPA: hypothetical protein VEI24_07775 [Nitrospiria bacterium]|nr:hypothetical protein [Nitrospiria bacterium]
MSVRELSRAALLTLALLPGIAQAAGEPIATVNDLDQARTALAQIQAKQRALGAREAEILVEEQRLDALVRQLKQESSGLTESLRKVRLDRALRQLRDQLIELQAVRREQQESNDGETAVRGRIAELLRVEANRCLSDAERAFKAGREEEANGLYRRSLTLMRESEQMTRAPIPPMLPDRHDFDPRLTGAESPDELIQISVLMRHEAEEIEQELNTLDQLDRRVRADLDFERRAVRFQGVRERETETASKPPTAASGETALQNRLAEIQARIVRDRARLRYYLQRADELDSLAASRERQLERRGR